MVLCAVLPVKTKTPLVMRIGLHDEGLVLLTPEIPGEPSEAVRRERGGNGFKRIRGFAHSGDSFRRSRFRRASGGPIFSVLPEKMGEKRGAGMRLVLSASGFRRGPGFQASFHSEVTLRVSAARRLIRGAKFAASCHRTFAVNRRCRPDLLVCTFLRGGFFARRG